MWVSLLVVAPEACSSSAAEGGGLWLLAVKRLCAWAACGLVWTQHLSLLLHYCCICRLWCCISNHLSGTIIQSGCTVTGPLPPFLTQIQRSSAILGIRCRGEEGTAGGAPTCPAEEKKARSLCTLYPVLPRSVGALWAGAVINTPVSKLDRKSQVNTPTDRRLSNREGGWPSTQGHIPTLCTGLSHFLQTALDLLVSCTRIKKRN